MTSVQTKKLNVTSAGAHIKKHRDSKKKRSDFQNEKRET